MLEKVISKSERIFMDNADRLAALQKRVKFVSTIGNTLPEISEPTICMWLGHVTHNPHGRHRKLGNYATAYYQTQEIIYNPHYLKKATEDDLLDTVLHELGHLFSFRFYREPGHRFFWKSIGTIVGYAEVGCTSSSRRKQYQSYAAHSGTVKGDTPPIGKIGTEPTTKKSLVESPVKLVWEICNRHPHATRREIIQRCIIKGVNRNTAQTQYYQWKKSRKISFFEYP